MKKNIRILPVIFFTLLIACGSSEIESRPPPNEDESLAPPSFILSSDFPSDIVIPDIKGMDSTAFIVSTSSPAGVIAVDINADTMKVSSKFQGLISPNGSGIPSKLLISSQDDAFLTTSNSLIRFSPKTGRVHSRTNLLSDVEIGKDHRNSDGTSSDEKITPNFPSGIARIGDRIFVAMSNYINTTNPAVAAPGIVRAFDIKSGGSMIDAGIIVTSAFNPTGLSVRNGEELIITNSGVINIINAESVPATDSVIDIADPETMEITGSIPLGQVAASFHAAAVTIDGSLAFVGSSAFGEVYEIDLINISALRGKNNPLMITDESDYMTDVKLSQDNSHIFIASFEKSAVYPVDISDIANPEVKDPIVVGYSSDVTTENPTGANTGAGPIAVRPGTRGIDYEGPDLFILTGYPGTLVAVYSDAPAKRYLPNEQSGDSESFDPPPPPEGNDGDSCQGFAQAVRSVKYGYDAGFGQDKFPDIVLGPPQGNGALAGGLDVLSLGKNGSITLDLGNCHAVDGPGADFIIFENAFYIGGDENAPFAELASVEVSADGINFKAFPCDTSAYPYDGCAGSMPVYSNSKNGISPFDPDLAGGNAFDLSEIGVARARYIKIKDRKSTGSKPVAGFDLDAISVVNGEIQN